MRPWTTMRSGAEGGRGPTDTLFNVLMEQVSVVGPRAGGGIRRDGGLMRI